MPIKSVAVLAVEAGKRKSRFLTNYFVLEECLHKKMFQNNMETKKVWVFSVVISNQLKLNTVMFAGI